MSRLSGNPFYCVSEDYTETFEIRIAGASRGSFGGSSRRALLDTNHVAAGQAY